jgi:8-oxo-dGTP pyrophosphatase MutT (NUDIX family)
MPEERSAGYVLYRVRDGEREYLIIKNRHGGHWGFPKGHLEPGETPLEAARREVAEEVNIGSIEHVPGFSESVSYRFHRGREVVKKTVTFFLGRAGETGSPDPREIDAMRWLPYSEAKRQLTYKEQKDILEKAERFLAGR